LPKEKPGPTTSGHQVFPDWGNEENQGASGKFVGATAGPGRGNTFRPVAAEYRAAVLFAGPRPNAASTPVYVGQPGEPAKWPTEANGSTVRRPQGPIQARKLLVPEGTKHVTAGWPGPGILHPRPVDHAQPSNPDHCVGFHPGSFIEPPRKQNRRGVPPRPIVQKVWGPTLARA